MKVIHVANVSLDSSLTWPLRSNKLIPILDGSDFLSIKHLELSQTITFQTINLAITFSISQLI